MEKLKILLQNKIKDHKNEIQNSIIKNNYLENKLKEGLASLNKKDHNMVIIASELQISKDKILFHKGAIAALEDLLNILNEAVKSEISLEKGDK